MWLLSARHLAKTFCVDSLPTPITRHWQVLSFIHLDLLLLTSPGISRDIGKTKVSTFHHLLGRTRSASGHTALMKSARFYQGDPIFGSRNGLKYRG